MTRLRTSLLCLLCLVCCSGCFNTTTLRTGRVLEAGESEAVVGLAYQHSAQPLMTATTAPDAHGVALDYRVPEDHPVQWIGLGRWGLGAGFELTAGIMPSLGPPGLLLGMRKALLTTDRFALAAAVEAAGNVVPNSDDAAGMSAASARAGLDMSFHSRYKAVYLSPAFIKMWAERTTSDADGNREGHASVDAVSTTVGMRFGRDRKAKAFYMEVGIITALSGETRRMVVPAIGTSW